MINFAEVVDQLAEHGWRLRKAWPRGLDRLLLDLQPAAAAVGPRVAGQWFAAPARASAVAAATPGAAAIGRLVIQPKGVDRRLPALARSLRRPGSELVGHRPERRAVVRDPDGGYTKFVRPDRWHRLVTTTRLAETLPVPTPKIIATDPVAATVTTDTLLGRTLTERLTDGSAVDACRAAGRTLAALHRIRPDPSLSVHDLAAERSVADHWQQQARDLSAPLRFTHRLASPQGPTTPPDHLAVIHRDLHDGQLLITDDGRVGVLDFDLVALGDPALDLANLVAHLELRAEQGMITDPQPLITAILDGYRPSTDIEARLPTYRALTWRRLTAVYAFRPEPLDRYSRAHQNIAH